MKKILFSLFFFSFMIVGAQAQKASCAKTCTKSSAASAKCQEKAPSVATANFNNTDEAAKMASLDATIETRKDASTGNTYYVRKETCAHSGSVSYVDVNFDPATNTFVNVSPMKSGAATTGSGCSKATSGKSCCAGKTATASKSAEKVKS